MKVRFHSRQKDFLLRTLFLFLLFCNIWLFYWCAIYPFTFHADKPLEWQILTAGRAWLLFPPSVYFTAAVWAKLNSKTKEQPTKTKKPKQPKPRKEKLPPLW